MFTRTGQVFIPSPNKFARKLINCQLVRSLFLFRLNLRRFCTVRLHKWDCKLYAVLEGNQLGDGFLPLLRAPSLLSFSFLFVVFCYRKMPPRLRILGEEEEKSSGTGDGKNRLKYKCTFFSFWADGFRAFRLPFPCLLQSPCSRI